MTAGVRTSLVAGAAIAVLWAVPAGGAATVAPRSSEGGPLTQSCRREDERLRPPCRGIEQLVWAGSALCRYYGVAPDETCATLISPRVSRAAVRAYEGSWTHRALPLQYELTGDVAFRDAPWIGTHNSFNSAAEMGPTLSDTDANQQLSIVDQLALDVRSIELDLHWFPNLRTGRYAPMVCHAFGNHVGCTLEKPLAQVLDEIAAWLRRPENRRQVLLLYIEDHLDGAHGHDSAAAALESRLGSLLYRPPVGAPGCTALPLDLTRNQILASGAQLIVATDCGPGADWPHAIFDWSRSHKEAYPVKFTDFPACGPDFDRPTYDHTLVRYLEDSTAVTAATAPFGLASFDDGITPQSAAQMARCGVDLTGMDHLLPDDGRLDALVWSWAPGQPGAGACAVQSVDARLPFGRWQSRACGERHTAACRAPDGTWLVRARATVQRAGRSRCRMLHARFAVPRSGYEVQLLRVAMRRAGVDEVWLGYRRTAGHWVAADRREALRRRAARRRSAL